MIAYFIIAIAVVLRVAAHASGFAFLPPNFAPIGGLALFSGAYLTGKKAFLIPAVALLVSDMFIGFYDWPVLVSVYGSFMVVALLGKWIKSHRENALYIGGAAVTSSVLFFLVTNFMVWVSPVSLYAPDLSGLLASYIAGLPFFKYTLAGDLFFTSTFFLTFELAKSMVKSYKGKLKLTA